MLLAEACALCSLGTQGTYALAHVKQQGQMSLYLFPWLNSNIPNSLFYVITSDDKCSDLGQTPTINTPSLYE